jgi:hypothetical protein
MPSVPQRRSPRQLREIVSSWNARGTRHGLPLVRYIQPYWHEKADHSETYNLPYAQVGGMRGKHDVLKKYSKLDIKAIYALCCIA